MKKKKKIMFVGEDKVSNTLTPIILFGLSRWTDVRMSFLGGIHEKGLFTDGTCTKKKGGT